MSIHERYNALPPDERRWCDLLMEEFEAAWSATPESPPAIEDRLPAEGPLRDVLLVDLIMTDLERRLKRRQAVIVADYVRRFPELGRDAEAMAALIQWEGEFLPWAPPPGFTEVEEIGRGSMGVVFSALEDQPRRRVALKFLAPHLAPDESSLKRLHDEADMVASVRHRNVLGIYRVGEHRNRLFCVFELCNGGDLAGRLKGTPMDPELAARLVAAVAAGVQAAHDAGVIHRDLKPANILFDDDGVPKVGDFSIARRPGDVTLTGTGDIVGTVAYASPEQVSNVSREPTAAVDVYSLGAILYHCLAGRPPFEARSMLATIDLVKTADPVPPSRTSGVPRDLDTICLKCLAKEPRRRYASATELADDLQRYLERRPIRARPPSPAMRLRLWCRRNPALAVATALSAAALVAIASLAIGFAIYQRSVATTSRRQEAIAKLGYSVQVCNKGDVGHGLLVLADALKTVPEGLEDAPLDQAVRIALACWRESCHTLRNVLGHPDEVLALDVSPDGPDLLTGCADGKIRIWDLLSDREPAVFDARQGRVNAVAFLPGGGGFLSGDDSGAVVVWDGKSGRRLDELRGHAKKVLAVAASPDGKLALTGSDDGTARLWDLDGRRCLSILKHSGPVYAVAFRPDRRSFATGAGDGPDRGECRLYDLAAIGGDESIPCKTVPFEKAVRALAFSPGKGETLLIGDDNWNAMFYDVDRGKIMASEDYTQGSVRAVAFSPRAPIALTAAYDSTDVYLWDVDRLRSEWAPRRGASGPLNISRKAPARPLLPVLRHPKPVAAAAASPTIGGLFTTACNDRYVRVWQAATGPEVVPLPHHLKRKDQDPSRRDHVVRDAAIDGEGRRAATAGWDGKVLLWDAASGNPDGPPLVHDSPVMNVEFMPDGLSLLTADKEGHIRRWDVASRRATFEFRHERAAEPDGKRGEEIDVSISRKGEEAFVGGGGRAQRWDLALRRKIGGPFKHSDDGNCSVNTAVSPDRQRFLTAGQDERAYLWDAEGRRIACLPHQGEVRYCDFSQDGSLVVTASDDRNVKVWDGRTGEPVATLPHESKVYSATFTPDGRRVLTGGEDGVQLWDLGSRERIGPAVRRDGAVMKVALTRNGGRAVFAEWNGHGRVWTLPKPHKGRPEEVRGSLESEVGLVPDGKGGLRVLTGEEWRSLHGP